MSKTGVPGTSSLKRWLVLSTEPVKMCTIAESQASSDQPQMTHFRTMLRETDMFACLLLGASSSMTSDTKLSGRPSSCQDHLPSFAWYRPKFSLCLPHSQWSRLQIGPMLMTLSLLLSSEGPGEGVLKNRGSSTSREDVAKSKSSSTSRGLSTS